MSQNTFSYKTATAEVILLAEVNAPRKADNLIGYTPQIAAETAPDNTYPGATNAFLVKKGGENSLKTWNSYFSRNGEIPFYTG